MNPTKEELDHKLIELETQFNVSEYDISSTLQFLRDGSKEEEPCKEWVYELMAFSFFENYKDEKTGWGTYFGPMHVVPSGNGMVKVSPSIQLVTEEVIAYWTQRCQSTSNPIMQARYAGLVWDFSEKVTARSSNYSVALIYCQALLKIAKERVYKHSVDVVQKLERALFIATSLKKQELIEEAKRTILDYECFVAEDAKPGLWGFSFDLLINNKKVALSDGEEKEIIETLEARLQRLKDGEPWICENAAERLARYYRSKKLDQDCVRVLKILGNTFEVAAAEAPPLSASSWLEHLHQIYVQFNLLDDAERITKTLRQLGPQVRDGMKEISHPFEIPRDEFEAYIEQMLEGSLDQVFAHVAIRYIPRRGEVENQLYNLARQAPISFLFTKQITDSQGRVVATIGSLDDDLDGNIVSLMSQNISVSAIFLSAILDRAAKKFSLTSDVFINYLFQSPVFDDSQKEFLLKGIQEYFEQDYLAAIHILIPQVEATVRNLVEIAGGAVLKRGRGGGFHLRTLDDILRSEEVMQSLGSDVAFYFRVVLTDQRGWNLRNDVCHGISQAYSFSKEVTERLLHILLVLAQLRLQDSSSGEVSV